MLAHHRDSLQPVVFGFDGAVLHVERTPQHSPAAVDSADAVSIVDPHVAVEDDVGAVAVDGANGLDVDARRVERHQKHGQVLVFWRVRVGVGQQEDVLRVVRVGREHLGAVNDPAVAVADRAGFAGRHIRAALWLGVAQAQPDLAGQHAGQHLFGEFRRSELAHHLRDHGGGAPVEPRRVRPTDLQIPDAPAQRAEAAVGFVVPVGSEITLGAQRQMHTLVEVLPALTVPADHVVGDDVDQECPQLIAEFAVVGRQFDDREVHDCYSRASVLIAVSVVRSGRISASWANEAISSPSSVCTAPRTYDMPAPT